MDKRLKPVFTHNNKHENVVYLMTKAFRIKNNYSLYNSILFKEKFNKNLTVVIVRGKEENSRNNAFFDKMTFDLKDRLKIYANEVKSFERDIFNVEKDLQNSYAILIDKPYLKEDKTFFERVKKYCEANSVSLYSVDTNVSIPTEITSTKEEYSAKTIRPKIHRNLKDFRYNVLFEEESTYAEEKAEHVLKDFIENKLENYDLRNEPSKDYSSGLSKYLKYGFISPNTILEYLDDINNENKDKFIEELIVRRELAYNFVLYNKDYSDFSSITYDWAYTTMKNHKDDEREYLYTVDDYVNFKTHDKYFNTAMKEMIHFGTMHSYMRMYWCKKIIEWSKTYKEAYETAIYLNNYYFLDGNTPNGYNGVAWCFGKHDRAWKERPIFGKLRYMNSNGLKNKFDIDKYVELIDLKIEKGEH